MYVTLYFDLYDLNHVCDIILDINDLNHVCDIVVDLYDLNHVSDIILDINDLMYHMSDTLPLYEPTHWMVQICIPFLNLHVIFPLIW